jgi:serine/threonine protein kinase
MSSERWKRIEQLYNQAADLEVGPLRAELLDRACAGDPELRRELDSLLQYEERARDFLEAAAPADAGVAAGASDQGSVSAAGRQMGPYRLLELLGAGGTGEVYLALDARSGRQAALKLLSAALCGDADWVRRFEKEARAIAALRHCGIPALYESGQLEGRRFIATEFIEGLTLRQRLAEAPLAPREALEVAIQAAEALAAAHAAGIVHRDIKPDNLMLARGGSVKVLDFGLAKQAPVPAGGEALGIGSTVTAPGMVLGTVAYMSPEQARGERVDVRTDLYSLGVVLYEMLAGRVPFEGRTPTYTISQILFSEAPPLAAQVPEVPAELAAVVARAMHKSRDERHQSAAELLGDLRRVQQRL